MNAINLIQRTELVMNFYRGYEHGKSPTNNRFDRDRR
jgi:hypothetical protein